MKAVQALETYGIAPGEDSTHHQRPDSGYIDPEAYFNEATSLLREIQPVVEGPVVNDLEHFAQRWNPGGFMVFPLGVHNALGSLRLHVFPPNVDRKSVSGPNIHNHAWHLCSLVLKGVYTDTLYDLDEVDNYPKENETALQLYNTVRDGDGKDVLVATGKYVSPVVIEERSIPADSVHTITAGAYHIPTMARELEAATLVFDSPAFASTTGVVLARNEVKIARIRRPLEVADIALARQVLLG